MGFDLCGNSPKDEKGEYFRNNVWWWRPLWDYVCQNCDDILSENDMFSGGYNDGRNISGRKAMKIGHRLD